MRDIPWCTRITNLRLEFWNSTPSLAFVIHLNGGTFFKSGFRDFKFIYQTSRYTHTGMFKLYKHPLYSYAYTFLLLSSYLGQTHLEFHLNWTVWWYLIVLAQWSIFELNGQSKFRVGDIDFQNLHIFLRAKQTNCRPWYHSRPYESSILIILGAKSFQTSRSHRNITRPKV